MLIDPLIPLAISLVFVAVFTHAVWHKLSAFAVFTDVVDQYRLVPTSLVGAAASGVVAAEALSIAAWLFAPMQVAVILSVLLLLLYITAIGVNLRRGRHYIDCGCGGNDNPISAGLVGRNVVLIAFALVALLPQSERALAWPDAVLLALALLSLGLLVTATNELLHNQPAFNAWRLESTEALIGDSTGDSTEATTAASPNSGGAS